VKKKITNLRNAARNPYGTAGADSARPSGCGTPETRQLFYSNSRDPLAVVDRQRSSGREIERGGIFDRPPSRRRFSGSPHRQQLSRSGLSKLLIAVFRKHADAKKSVVR
jgi:hypothetical protein